MRIGAIVLGIILLGLGVWVALGDAHYNDSSTKAQFGPVKVEATTQKQVPVALGYAGIVIGGILIVGGALTKR